jgi:hypothetical protein
MLTINAINPRQGSMAHAAFADAAIGCRQYQPAAIGLAILYYISAKTKSRLNTLSC